LIIVVFTGAGGDECFGGEVWRQEESERRGGDKRRGD